MSSRPPYIRVASQAWLIPVALLSGAGAPVHSAPCPPPAGLGVSGGGVADAPPIEVVVHGEAGMAVLPSARGSAGWPRLVALRRDPAVCRWLIGEGPETVLEGAGSGAVAPAASDPAPVGDPQAMRATVAAFERTARAEGTATALHVYLLDAALRLTLDETATFDGAAEVDPYLMHHPIDGTWHAERFGHSREGAWMFAEGTLLDAHRRTQRRYLELWQYDPRVANYGLRLLWFGQPTARR